tara:strand:- start:14712 stop:14951 length:240 start_codon:yes stop_codon:yes gene_type:complete
VDGCKVISSRGSQQRLKISYSFLACALAPRATAPRTGGRFNPIDTTKPLHKETNDTFVSLVLFRFGVDGHVALHPFSLR